MLRRLIVMALLGAAGAGLGGGVGEGLFHGALRAPEAAPGRQLCLVFDLSDSMMRPTADGVSQLDALRRAALDFVAKPEFEHDHLALVGFADDAWLLSEPGPAATLRPALEGMRTGGATDIGRGLELAQRTLAAPGTGEAWILLFTDGKPQTSRAGDAAAAARQAAQACRTAGIHIVAVGTGLAERAFLEELAGEPANVFVSAPEALADAFQSSGERIQSRQMLASSPATIDLELSLQRACGWAALVAFGAGLALVFGHNRHLHRRGLRVGQLALVSVGAAASGLAAGFAGQGTFYALSGSAAFEPALRVLAWLLLGSGVGLGMSCFVPNLPRVRALVGGALGGGAAVTCFLRIVPAVGDTPGRLLGAALLGLMAGAMTVLVEASVRKAWLVVRWPGDETTTLLLGPTPIVVGHSASAHICPVFDEKREAVLGHFTHTEAGIRYVDQRSGEHRALRAGDKVRFEPILVEVHAESGSPSSSRAAAPSAPSSPRRSPAPPAPKAALPRQRPAARATPPSRSA